MRLCRVLFPTSRRTALLGTTLLAATIVSVHARQTETWVERSDRNTKLLTDILSPSTSDEEIVRPDSTERMLAGLAPVKLELEKRLDREQDTRVREDLQILIEHIAATQRTYDLQKAHEIPYSRVVRWVWVSTQQLLNDQVAPARRQAALVRFRRYAGLAPGYEPITTLAERYSRSRMTIPGVSGPARALLEDDLKTTPTLIAGIRDLFRKYQVPGYEEVLAAFEKQVDEYSSFVRTELLPRGRQGFRLPADQYANLLSNGGVDSRPESVASDGRRGFQQIRHDMQVLAEEVAKQRGWPERDYRAVVQRLKDQQLAPGDVLEHYRGRLKEIEAAIEEHRLVTLPKTPLSIRVATEAESAVVRAPHFRMPPFVNNRGERGEFIIPTLVRTAQGSIVAQDDFTYPAASWAITAHEARPGHELQVSTVLANGVSKARTLFANNSTNLEGWALYAESMIEPFMPADGRLVTLQLRLLRAARAFLDPELQAGVVTVEEARRLLREDVGLSESMADQEIARYTVQMPGQAPTYYYGFTRYREIRDRTARILGSKFHPRAFHDFLLDQGFLPLPLLARAVTERFVPSQRGPGSAIEK